jgi:hypothetical protein
MGSVRGCCSSCNSGQTIAKGCLSHLRCVVPIRVFVCRELRCGGCTESVKAANVAVADVATRNDGGTHFPPNSCGKAVFIPDAKPVTFVLPMSEQSLAAILIRSVLINAHVTGLRERPRASGFLAQSRLAGSNLPQARFWPTSGWGDYSEGVLASDGEYQIVGIVPPSMM